MLPLKAGELLAQSAALAFNLALQLPPRRFIQGISRVRIPLRLLFLQFRLPYAERCGVEWLPGGVVEHWILGLLLHAPRRIIERLPCGLVKLRLFCANDIAN